MKIYFVLKNVFPNGNASTARVINYCTGFISNGKECEVVIPVAIERYEDPVKNTESKGVYRGIPFRYISGTPRRGKSLIKRQLKDRLDYAKTLCYLLSVLKRGDSVIVYEGGCIWFSLLSLIVHFKKAKIIMELNELPYGTGKETPKNKRLREKMLTKIFPKFDAFISISESLSDLVKEHAPNSSNIKVPIIVDVGVAKDVETENPQRPYIFHSGTLYEQKDGVVGMIEAFAIANRKLGNKIDFILTGSLEKSPDRDKIQEIIDKYNIGEYVKFVGYLFEKELRKYQKNCFMMIINKHDNQQNHYCFSTKLGEYLAFSKPIVITDVGEAMYYLNDSNSYIVERDDTNQIADKIIEICDDPEKAAIKGQEGYKLAENIFSNTFQAKRIFEFLEGL